MIIKKHRWAIILLSVALLSDLHEPIVTKLCWRHEIWAYVLWPDAAMSNPRLSWRFRCCVCITRWQPVFILVINLKFDVFMQWSSVLLHHVCIAHTGRFPCVHWLVVVKVISIFLISTPVVPLALAWDLSFCSIGTKLSSILWFHWRFKLAYDTTVMEWLEVPKSRYHRC